MKRIITKSTWAEIRTAYASGIGLREIARNMNVPEGTVLARAKREGWTQQIAAAKIASQPQLAKEIVKADAINRDSDAGARRTVPRTDGWCKREGCGTLLETMGPDDILNRASQLERFDTVARRTFGLNEAPSGQGCLSLSVLTNHPAVQVKALLPTIPSPGE